ncbi:hypothetical protein PFICI_07202 [Pestalotiopsis fici W106-1]|uniref:Membrane anchor Opy2 N-terminal domain-containing protein n=1 Tax=Pestalotiopsis fici (strain W106-1 / CGMCC3.15140) TaxID=1229662 RepID=W3X822_PESFW|nr:uncharacterized protein PFICI_07202 [Pestalotiopsis fici W106-1]ETS82200.1 hypothetical protein PFICI_07202 [Pestalotiopsis fici W106-1]
MSPNVGVAAEGFPTLFARQNGCVQCDTTSLSCPSCADNESCAFSTQTCSECPKAYCAADDSSDSDSSSGSGSGSKATVSSGPNVGAIAGGVIGGLAVIGIITYLVWRFCIKAKRDQWQNEPWAQDGPRSKEGSDMDYASRASQARQSTHSVHSMASTVLTRASNIIQIAYIPGVTNRATPTSPTLLVPPVPPIPMSRSEAGTPSPYEEQHFFVPGNLRDSSYSGISGYSDRTSYARSYAPRSSVASTIYGKNAVVSPMPAQKGTLLKPSLVSVKSKGASSGSSTPPVPQVDYDKYDQPPASPAFSIGATFFKNANTTTATAMRPQMVQLGSSGSNGVKTIDVKKASPSVSVNETDSDSTMEDADAHKDLNARGATPSTPITTAPREEQSPFSDPPQNNRTSKHKSSNSLSAIITEATQRAASRTSSASSKVRGSSPFSDDHALRD